MRWYIAIDVDVWTLNEQLFVCAIWVFDDGIHWDAMLLRSVCDYVRSICVGADTHTKSAGSDVVA